ncbi:hypothetical protein GSI_01440 [Ganoderma sinense ZZ0214-1]|uniref:Impact N-terminal domain-containing protein n=1 Tax=Ganoderma sinense ZZ0214-1 TaxID=1077348 RepID=A0A2G8SVE8_9APHY|nr:hypothetical protein GSI_01440 [Ganoderma sinense ZZ0214-1]
MQEVENVLVIVTRYFGGIHLGPDRFKHINQAARNALELGGSSTSRTTTTADGSTGSLVETRRNDDMYLQPHVTG